MSSRDCAEEPGYNSRLDEVQAEILRRKLRRLDGYIAQRRRHARRYDEILKGTSLTLPVSGAGKSARFLHVCLPPPGVRDRIMAEMLKMVVRLLISYRNPIHLMPAYRHLTEGAGSLETEKAAAQIFSLPLYPRSPRLRRRYVAAWARFLASMFTSEPDLNRGVSRESAPVHRHFCTMFDSGYFSRGLALYSSLAKHCPAFTLYALCIDVGAYREVERLGLPNVVIIGLHELEADDTALQPQK